MTTTPRASGNGISFFTILGLIFITLKLTGYITWSWWWVTFPLWGGAAIILGIVAIVFLFACVASLLDRP